MRSIKILFAFFLVGFYLSQKQMDRVLKIPGSIWIISETKFKSFCYLSQLCECCSTWQECKKSGKTRQEVLNAITDTRFNIQGMPPWKGDKSYRDSTVAYLKLLNIVFNEDYGRS